MNQYIIDEIRSDQFQSVNSFLPIDAGNSNQIIKDGQVTLGGRC